MPFITKSYNDHKKVYDIYGLCFKHNNKRNNILSMFSFNNEDKIISGYDNIILEYWFYKSGPFLLPNGYSSADIFLVGGGGGGEAGYAYFTENSGGSAGGGNGGGGGAVNIQKLISIKNKNINITIGSGGRGGSFLYSGSYRINHRSIPTVGTSTILTIDEKNYVANGGSNNIYPYSKGSSATVYQGSYNASLAYNGTKLFGEDNSEIYFGGSGGGGWSEATGYSSKTGVRIGSSGRESSHGLGTIGGGGNGGFGYVYETSYSSRKVYSAGEGGGGSSGIVIMRLFASKFRPDEKNRKIKKIEVK